MTFRTSFIIEILFLILSASVSNGLSESKSKMQLTLEPEGNAVRISADTIQINLGNGETVILKDEIEGTEHLNHYDYAGFDPFRFELANLVNLQPFSPIQPSSQQKPSARFMTLDFRPWTLDVFTFTRSHVITSNRTTPCRGIREEIRRCR